MGPSKLLNVGRWQALLCAIVGALLLCLAAPFPIAWSAPVPRRLEAQSDAAGGQQTAKEQLEEAGLVCPQEGEGADSFGRLLNVGKLPPYYFMMLATVTKPMVSTAIFGPPVPKPPEEGNAALAKRCAKQAVQLCLLAMALLQACADIGRMAEVLRASVSLWERLLAVAVIASASTNLQAGFNAWALHDLVNKSLMWAQSHNYLEGVSARQHMGPAGFAYVLVLQAMYLPLAVLLMLMVLPVMLAYVYVTIALALLVFGNFSLFLSCFVEGILPRVRGGAKHDALLKEATTEEAAAERLLAMGNDWGGGDAMKPYEAEMKSYKETGVPQFAWVGYAFSSLVFPPFIYVLVPVAARLYAAKGYWPALATTLSERHLAAYLGCSLGKVSTKLQLLWLLV